MPALGSRQEAELAERYLLLSDKGRLAVIEARLTESTRAERRRVEDLAAVQGMEAAESNGKEMASHQATLADGRVVLKKGRFRREFPADPDLYRGRRLAVTSPPPWARTPTSTRIVAGPMTPVG